MRRTDFKRYDAWGNAILPLDAMLAYYANDAKSLEVLNSKLPHRYAVIPTVEIHIAPNQTKEVYVYYIFPGGNESQIIYPSQHALCALRKAYKGRGGWKGYKNKFGYFIIRREGRVIPLSYQKFGLYV